jgi:hypothetical protein
VSDPGSDAVSDLGSDTVSDPGSDAVSDLGSDAVSDPGWDTVRPGVGYCIRPFWWVARSSGLHSDALNVPL